MRELRSSFVLHHRFSRLFLSYRILSFTSTIHTVVMSIHVVVTEHSVVVVVRLCSLDRDEFDAAAPRSNAQHMAVLSRILSRRCDLAYVPRGKIGFLADSFQVDFAARVALLPQTTMSVRPRARLRLQSSN